MVRRYEHDLIKQARQVSLMSIKVLGPNDGKSSDIIRGYAYAKMMRDLWVNSGGAKGANIRVLNNSYGGGEFSQAELDAIRALSDSDILFVASAGNDGQYNDFIPHYPSSYLAPNVISVSATNRNDRYPSFTNPGSTSVNLAAPGESILSTTPNNTYDVFSGTSMATPHVTGVAALVCAAYSQISMRRLRASLLYSGDLLFGGASTRQYNSDRRLNIYNALQNAALIDTTPPSAIREYNISFGYAPGDDGDVGHAAAYDIRISDMDLSDPSKFEVARPMGTAVPSSAGIRDSFDVTWPYRHPTGFIGIRAIDKAGIAGPITSLPFYNSPDQNDPYIASESPPSALSTGGTPLGLIGDDKYKTYTLPFPFAFISDRSSVVAGSGLEQSKSAHALNVVQRSAFVQQYPRSWDSEQFVDTLLSSINQHSGVSLSSQRSALISLYDGTDDGHAAILKQIADTQSFIDGEYNNSFVLMEYFGYLRRDPDQGGFDFWLGQVNKFPLRNVSIQHAMACSFITSTEYQLRFGSVVTHSNKECPQ